MSISDADFLQWLDEDHPRCVLVEASVCPAGGSSPVVRRLSTLPYITAATDSPSLTPYDEIVISIPAFRSGIDTRIAGGAISLANDGSLDSWLFDGWGKREVTILLGDPSWPRADFRVFIAGITDTVGIPNDSTFEILIADRKELLNKPFPNEVVASGEKAGQLIPAPIGTCFNVSPLYSEPTSYTYRLAAGVHAITGVRDSGDSVAATATVMPSAGTIALGSPADGEVTCDVQGLYYRPSLSDPAYNDTASAIIRTILHTPGVVDEPASLIDEALLADFEDKQPLPAGIVVAGRENLVAVIDAVMAGVFGYWSFTRAGKIKPWVLRSGLMPSDAMVLTEDDIVYGSLALVRKEPPWAKIRLGLKRNQTIQAISTLKFTVPESDKAMYSSEWLGGIVEKVPTRMYPDVDADALTPDVFSTVLNSENHALRPQESTIQAALHSLPRYVFRAQFIGRAVMLNPGDCFRLFGDRWFYVSRDAQVLNIDADPVACIAEIEFLI